MTGSSPVVMNFVHDTKLVAVNQTDCVNKTLMIVGSIVEDLCLLLFKE
jgi:hypothetical protein